MRDRHLNLFLSYSESAVWEDNFTRAFALTLQQLAPVHFRMFIRDMLLREEHKELQAKIAAHLTTPLERRVELQVPRAPSEEDDQSAEAKSEKLTSEDGVLVTIDAEGTDELLIGESSAGGSRVDAVVSDETAGVTAVIEIKLDQVRDVV